MTTNFEASDESYQTVLDISKTISKSKEVVNQSKSLWNRFKGFNHSNINTELKTVESSYADISLLSPTARGLDSESFYIHENSMLRSRLDDMQKEINFLNGKLQTQQAKIEIYEQQLKKIDFPPQPPRSSHISLKLSPENSKTDYLEERLQNVTNLYEKQVHISKLLQAKLNELTIRPSDSKLSKIEEKLKNSSKTLQKLTKRLEKTETCLSLTTSPILSKSRKSCYLLSHKSKS